MISKGLAARLRQTAVLLVAVGGPWMAPVAHSAVTDQILDQVEVASASKLLRLQENPTSLVGLAAVRQTQFRACQSSNVNGLFCLDGQVVRSWPTVTEHTLNTTPSPESGIALFSCQDTALGLSSSACSAMTADVNGDIWIAGRKPDATWSIFRVTSKVGGVCPIGSFAFQGATASTVLDDQSENYCASEVRTGRQQIRDLSPVDGELVTGFFSDKGILGVENFAKVVFYPRDKTKPVVEWADWGGVQITSASILQRVSNSSTTITYGLITTTAGEVVSRKLPAGAPVTVISIDGDLGPLARGTTCVDPNPNSLNTFRIRGSEISGRLFATNRDYCRLFVLEPVYSSSTQDLVGVTGASLNLLTGTQGGTTYPPDNLSVAPGNSVNVADPKCATLDGCVIIGDSDGDGNGYPAVKMYGVTVEGSATGLFVFKIDDIPDCRYIRQTFPASHPCNQTGTVVPPSGSTVNNSKPQQQYLNVTPLLPPNVTDLFDASGAKPFGLPPMYISPRYRAQQTEAYKFQALFGVADPNIQFRKTFTVEFDIGDFNLAGAALGCGVQETPNPLKFNQWDIVTVVSERFSSVGGPKGIVLDNTSGAAEHVDTLINKGCYNPTSSAGTRWSMYSYNLALAEDKLTNTSATYSPAIAYLSNLVLSLHTDLGDAQKRLACANVDAIGNTLTLPTDPPLTQATCDTLNTQWANAQDKLKKCAAAAQNPKNSAPNQNCNAFVSQFNTYKTMVEALIPNGTDPANRVGELWSRTDVIKYVYSHFVKAAQIGPTAANADPNSPP